jgi:hypothetical protein
VIQREPDLCIHAGQEAALMMLTNRNTDLWKDVGRCVADSDDPEDQDA